MKNDNLKVKFSIKRKLFLTIIAFSTLLTSVALYSSYFVYKSSSEKVYGNIALSLAKTEAKSIDLNELKTLKTLVLDKFNEICSANENKAPTFENDEEYNAYLDSFKSIQSESSFLAVQKSLDGLFLDNSASSVYVGFIDYTHNAFVFFADSKHSDNYAVPGSFDNGLITEQSEKIRNLPAKDQILEPYFDESVSYGHLMCAAAPIVDTDNSLICHAYVDIDFSIIYSSINGFINTLAILLFGFALLLTVGIVVLFNFTLIKPIKKLDAATTSYLNTDNQDPTNITEISKLKINTKDEVQHLTQSIQTLEKNIANYIRSIESINAEKERYSTELDIAEKIQMGLLPHEFPSNENYRLNAYVNPAKEVGGDFYDFFMVDETHIALVMADVSGKGIPAALFMAIGKTLIKDHTITSKNLSDTFTDVNNLLSHGNNSDMFITAYEGVLDLETGEYKFVNAGHEMPFIYKKKTNTFESYRCKPGFVLAGMPGIKYQEGQIKLEPGDKIFLYTDGVTEATDDSKNQFSLERLQRALRENRTLSPSEIIEEVKDRVDHFVKGAPQFDDITMLCFEFIHKIEGKTRTIEVGANLSNFEKVLNFINDTLDEHYIEKKTINKIDIALDELFSNVCNYAYEDGLGKVKVAISVTSAQIKISLIDDGKPYNPLEHEDPDITESVKERKIGGLGIMMVKKTMDEVKYEYKHKQNIITIIKNI